MNSKNERLKAVVAKVDAMFDADESVFLKASDEDMARFLVDAELIAPEYLKDAGRNMWIFSCYNELFWNQYQFHYFLSGFMADPDNE